MKPSLPNTKQLVNDRSIIFYYGNISIVIGYTELSKKIILIGRYPYVRKLYLCIPHMLVIEECKYEITPITMFLETCELTTSKGVSCPIRPSHQYNVLISDQNPQSLKYFSEGKYLSYSSK